MVEEEEEEERGGEGRRSYDAVESDKVRVYLPVMGSEMLHQTT